MQRIILHLDLDYFYAQVEEARNPEIKNKPVVICQYSGRSEDSGAVATTNYIARKFNVNKETNSTSSVTACIMLQLCIYLLKKCVFTLGELCIFGD